MQHTRSIKLKLLATGEIQVRMLPGVAKRKRRLSGSLDHKCEFQAIYDGYATQADKSELTAESKMSPGYGVLGRPVRFTRQARSIIREAGAALDELFGRNVLFLTWTLPGTGDDLYESLAANIGWLTQNVLQWIRDRIPDVQYIWVNEAQKRGALHQHIVVASQDIQGLADIQRRWPSRVKRFFGALSRRCGKNFFAVSGGLRSNISACNYGQNAQFAHKSVARYLAKYVSKAKTKDGNALRYPPPRWYRCSKRLLAAVERMRDSATFQGTLHGIAAVAKSIAGMGHALGNVIKQYDNRVFPWLKNLRLWCAVPPEGRFGWEIIQARLTKEPGITRLSVRSHGYPALSAYEESIKDKAKASVSDILVLFGQWTASAIPGTEARLFRMRELRALVAEG